VTQDDRQEFSEQAREDAIRMTGDAVLSDLALRTIAASDLHRYSYLWTWLGVPVIQMPEDVVALQEIIWATRPQVVVETGFARGGSALLYSSMLELLGEGLVVSVDVDFRPHNRRAVEEHPFGHRVTLVEGSSTALETVSRVGELIPTGARVMAVLDSNHTYSHVLEELHLYGSFVTNGQFLVVSDTVVDDIPKQAHRPREWGPGNSPRTAVDEFLATSDRFVADQAANAKLLISSSKGGYLRCVKDLEA
jgi:cephalosporin hydroxylase